MKAFVCVLIFVFSTLSFANTNENIGVFMIVKGEINIKKPDGSSERARIGTRIFAKDIILVSENARGRIAMTDSNIINLSPDTKLEFEEYTAANRGANKNATINLIYGKVRSQVKQKYDEEKETFRVKTPAAVAGVRGTDFMVSFENNQTEVVTFSGMVSVGTGIEDGNRIANPIDVRPGQATVVAVNSRPNPPRRLAANTLANLDKDSDADNDDVLEDSREPANLPSSDDETSDESNTETSTEPTSEASEGTSAEATEESTTPARRPSSASSPPPPPPPTNERPVLDVGIDTTINQPQLPPTSSLPDTNIVDDIIQQTNTNLNIRIIAP